MEEEFKVINIEKYKRDVKQDKVLNNVIKVLTVGLMICGNHIMVDDVNAKTIAIELFTIFGGYLVNYEVFKETIKRKIIIEKYETEENIKNLDYPEDYIDEVQDRIYSKTFNLSVKSAIHFLVLALAVFGNTLLVGPMQDLVLAIGGLATTNIIEGYVDKKYLFKRADELDDEVKLIREKKGR